MKKFRYWLAAAVVAGTAALTALPAAASTAFIARVESPHMILTPVHLHAGEVIRLSGGQQFTVVTEQFNGGGTIATVDVQIPGQYAGKSVIFTS